VLGPEFFLSNQSVGFEQLPHFILQVLVHKDLAGAGFIAGIRVIETAPRACKGENKIASAWPICEAIAGSIAADGAHLAIAPERLESESVLITNQAW
jgi:hypothetical protein